MDEPPGQLDDYIDYVKRHASADDGLSRLAEAATTADHLTRLADRLLGHFVEGARESGASWTQIGRSLGVTKQAAQQRFVGNGPSVPPTRRWRTPPDWITAETVALVEQSVEEAVELRHPCLDTQHLVLAGLVDPDGPIARIVHAAGVTPEAVRAAVIDAFPPRAERVEHVPTLARWKEAIDARRIAKPLGRSQVGPEHVLLNLLSNRKPSPVVRTLNEMGITEKHVKSWLARQ